MLIDALIVGQGLAGSLLAWELIRRRQRVLVLDAGEENASQVAAGLINPITGRRLLKSPEIDTLLPAAMHCYRQLGVDFQQQFFVELPMLRILQNPAEQTHALQRLQQVDYRAYLQAMLPEAAGYRAEFGVLQQTQTGYLRTRLLLTCLREFLIAKAAYRQVRLDYAEISLEPGLRWRDIQARHIVFCEGHRAIFNPWFRQLPFQLAKGEIISCATNTVCPNQILNYGRWLIPLDTGHFKTGATFDAVNLNFDTSEATKTVLLNALQAVCPALQRISVYEHKAGIRPTTLDKQPFIGSHPRHAQLHIFNGFGAKGSLAIPWFAKMFADNLGQKDQLPITADIRRYYATHFLT
jgi:glycine/D-amino acid oxidase-like deaminating enzyme